MPIPGTQEIRKPLLEAFRGEAPRSFATSEILELMAGYFGLNLNDLSSGDKNILRSRINEAKSDLKKNSLLYNPSNNTYMITNAGNEVLDDNPEIITDQYLYDRKHKPLPVAETFGLEAPDPEPPAPEPAPVMPPVETEPEELTEEPLPNIPELEPELPEEIPELELEPETETFQEEAAELEAIETEEEPETEAMTELEPELPEELPEISPEEQPSDDITLEDEPEAITEEYAEPETEEQKITEEIEPEEPEFPEASEEDENYTETEPAGFEGSEDFSGQEFENAPEEILEPGEEYKEEMPEDTYNPEETQEELATEEYSEPEGTQETEYDTEPDIQPEEEPEEEPEEIEEDESFLTASIPSNNIDDVIARHNSELADELLMRAAGLPSDRFEMLVIDLLSKMGYFAFQTARYTTESSGSDLIHGVILDNKTGANIYIQARKLSPGRTVGRADIQDFVEELSDKGGKGIYATTATFSENAKVYANDERIMLIDGVKLANLMIANNFCVNVEKVYEVKAIDGESFSEYED